MPAEIDQATDNRIAGSDIIALRYFAPEGVPVTAIGGSGGAPTFSFDSSRWDVLRSGVDNPGLFGVADCMNATVFEAGDGSTNGMIVMDDDAPENETPFSKVFTAGQAMLYRAESVVYYIGLNDAPTPRPSLYRVRFQTTPGGDINSSTVKQELVEGIENLQLLYGQDSELDPTKSPTGYVDSVGTAATVDAVAPADNSWRRVGLVQVGLLAASDERARVDQAEAAVSPSSLGVAFTLPDDGRYRTVYQSTVALRNRLYGN